MNYKSISHFCPVPLSFHRVYLSHAKMSVGVLSASQDPKLRLCRAITGLFCTCRSAAGGSPLCFVFIPHPDSLPGTSRTALAGPQPSLVLPGPVLVPGDTTDPQAPHQPHGNPLSPSHAAGGPFPYPRASPTAASLSFSPIWERLVSPKGLK